MPKKRLLAAAALIASAGLLLSACASSSAPDSGETAAADSAPTVSKVTIDTTSMTGANELAKAGGFFDDAFGELGISVEYTSLGTSTQMLEGIASGSLDFADIGYVAIPTGAAAGVPFTVLGQASTGGGDMIISALDGPSSVKDLKGKTVATSKGSSAWALLVRALDDAGLSTDDITMIDLKPDEAQNAFLTNQVDSWAFWAGTKTDAVNDSNSKTVITGAELGLIPGAIIARTALTESDPAVVEAFLKARQAAIDWFAAEPEKAAEAIAADRNTTAATVTTFATTAPPLNLAASKEVIASWQATAELFASLGEVSSAAEIAPLVDNSFIETALN